MKKASLLASAAAATLAFGAVPAFAQNAAGPFADVPTDHWAYSAVDRLQKAGIVIGYPDMTYGGKRAMTRYEFAVAIARLLDKMQTPQGGGITQEQLNAALAPYALKSDLAGLAKQSDVDTLRRLVQEFQTELTTLGVDLDAVRRRVDALEGRVRAIEQELKRVQIGGAVNLMGRANNRFDNAGSIRDYDGYEVTRGFGSRGGLLADARVLHDIDLNIKARLSDTATAEAILNFGNYLPFLGSVASYTGARSDRGAFGIYPGQVVNQEQSQTIYKAVVDVPIRFFGSAGAALQVGRMPVQLTPYTLKLIDTDTYFNNMKTDLGDVPMDGAKARLNLGPVATTLFAAKTDPIKFVSNIADNFSDQRGIQGTFGFQGYGLYAGASQTANGFGNAGTAGFRGGNRAVVNSNGLVTATGNRPVQSSIAPNRNGAMRVEQMAGARATIGTGSLGTIGGTILAMSGASSIDPTAAQFNARGFNRVYVYGADINANIGGIGLVGYYSKSDTAGEQVNPGGATLDGDIEDKITDDNDAFDIAATFARGNLFLRGGYRQINPFFAAPGYWDKIGAWTNPTDIKGTYIVGKYAFTNALAFSAEGRFYQGTGERENEGGLTTDDKIQNLRAGLKFGLTSTQGVDLGIERTEYKLGRGPTAGSKPIEYFYNIGYGFSFNPATSLKVLYQIVDYRDKNSGFDTLNTKGGVAAAQFSVKF
jgi:hypothetical protein